VQAQAAGCGLRAAGGRWQVPNIQTQSNTMQLNALLKKLPSNKDCSIYKTYVCRPQKEVARQIPLMRHTDAGA
jgi:hypothetical protein